MKYCCVLTSRHIVQDYLYSFKNIYKATDVLQGQTSLCWSYLVTFMSSRSRGAHCSSLTFCSWQTFWASESRCTYRSLKPNRSWSTLIHKKTISQYMVFTNSFAITLFNSIFNAIWYLSGKWEHPKVFPVHSRIKLLEVISGKSRVIARKHPFFLEDLL